MDMDRIDEVVKAGALEIWEITNNSRVMAMLHPFHIHNVQFQILSRSNSQLLAHEQGLKDTVLVNPSEKVKVLVKFPKYRDKRTPYMYHCHTLEHEDAGMMGQFVVV